MSLSTLCPGLLCLSVSLDPLLGLSGFSCVRPQSIATLHGHKEGVLLFFSLQTMSFCYFQGKTLTCGSSIQIFFEDQLLKQTLLYTIWILVLFPTFALGALFLPVLFSYYFFGVNVIVITCILLFLCQHFCCSLRTCHFLLMVPND